LSKWLGVAVEDKQKVNQQPKNKNEILRQNEKSKAKEAPDSAGSGVRRYKGYTFCKPLDV
jgi:hypothetical protein